MPKKRKAVAKPSFSQMVSSGGQLASKWGSDSLRFEGEGIEMDEALQERILADYILTARTFRDACQMNGISDLSLIERLEERIPERWKNLRERIGPMRDRGMDRGEEDVGPLIAQLWRFADMSGVIAESKFMAMTLTPKDLKELTATTVLILDRLREFERSEGTEEIDSDLGRLLPIGLNRVAELKETVRQIKFRRTAQHIIAEDAEITEEENDEGI
jgi:hypothetical protein